MVVCVMFVVFVVKIVRCYLARVRARAKSIFFNLQHCVRFHKLTVQAWNIFKEGDGGILW